jgi:hypothetical protein
MIDRVKGNQPVIVLLGLTLVSLVVLALLPPIRQDQSYHQFADQRTLLGIPNFWNVVSNLPFIVIGAVGLWRFHRNATTIVLFAGILLTGVGSSYYHWNPNDDTLLWDRLPIALSFMAIFAYAIGERVNAKAGAVLYGWVQFFPCIALPVLFLLSPAQYTGTSYWIMAAVLYLLAKVAEYQDRTIYSAGSILSGHTLKHLLAAAACYAILRYFQTRRPIA